ncbi:MAG TPA: polyphosphate kinase 1 [Gemmatimonadales bacterium]|nr:polyphosphate kinase 1 [Gemmatimonadales bacterium]
MPPPAEFRCDVPSAELLIALAAEPLPLGLRQLAVERRLYRDVYVDTGDNALATRGITCRIRYGADDRRRLTLGLAEPGLPVPGAQEVFEAEATEVDLPAILRGDSEPARRLRGVIDPARLEPRLELEVERTVRTAGRAWPLPGRFAFMYDQVTVRNGALSREFRELKVRRLRGGGPRLETVARALEQARGLRPVLQTKLARARELLRQMGRESVVRNLDLGRAVAVIALENGRVALLADGPERRLPVMSGAGEHAARHGLAEWFGTRVADVVLVGRAAASIEQPSLEVWVARRLRRGLEPSEGRRLEWMPVAEFARAVRTSTLHDPATRAAFGLAARSALVPEWTDATDSVAAHTEPGGGDTPEDLLDPRRSLLEFNSRVLAVAEDERTPLLERLRYIAIVSANLDEYYMSGGRAAAEPRARELLGRQQAAIEAALARLAEQGYRLRRWDSLDDGDRDTLRARFRREFFAALTPRAITMSPGHPFPLIPALMLSVAVALQGGETGPLHFAYVRLPPTLPRFVPLAGGRELVPIEDIVVANLGLLYPDRVIEEVTLFRVTRAGDLELDDAEAGDLLQAIEEELDQRAVNPAVRVELRQGTSPLLRDMLVQELRFEGGAVVGDLVIHEVAGLMAPADLRLLAALPVPDAAFPPFTGRDPLPPGRTIWELVRERDRLVHHPYDDFGATVLRLLEEAAADPAVVSMKLTLYRTGESSPVIAALLRAAAAGKEVVAFVELKASYDEARNIAWVRQLEGAGAQVIYGVVGLKNHAKVALVARREEGEIRRYAHVGTGNYNAATARFYTDLGLLTADPAIADDLGDLFNQLTGSSRAPAAPLRRLLAAPEHLGRGLLDRIAREAAHARAGRGGRIRAKLNGLDDPEIIRALYGASEAGVEIDLVVRGLCTLKPGVPGLSERIRVRGTIGRFLEHARIYHFANAGDDDYFIASADWRTRNLHRRVEIAAPVLEPDCRRRLAGILEQELADRSAWELAADGSYRQQVSLAVGDPATAQAMAGDQRTEEEVVWAG